MKLFCGLVKPLTKWSCVNFTRLDIGKPSVSLWIFIKIRLDPKTNKGNLSVEFRVKFKKSLIKNQGNKPLTPNSKGKSIYLWLNGFSRGSQCWNLTIFTQKWSLQGNGFEVGLHISFVRQSYYPLPSGSATSEFRSVLILFRISVKSLVQGKQ